VKDNLVVSEKSGHDTEFKVWTNQANLKKLSETFAGLETGQKNTRGLIKDAQNQT